MSDTPQGLDFEAAHKESSLSVRRYAAIESALQAQHRALLDAAVAEARREERYDVANRLREIWLTSDNFSRDINGICDQYHHEMMGTPESP